MSLIKNTMRESAKISIKIRNDVKIGIVDELNEQIIHSYIDI